MKYKIVKSSDVKVDPVSGRELHYPMKFDEYVNMHLTEGWVLHQVGDAVVGTNNMLVHIVHLTKE